MVAPFFSTSVVKRKKCNNNIPRKVFIYFSISDFQDYPNMIWTLGLFVLKINIPGAAQEYKSWRTDDLSWSTAFIV